MGTFWGPFLPYKFAFAQFRFSCFLKDAIHIHFTFQMPVLQPLACPPPPMLYHVPRRPFLTVIIILGLFFVLRNSQFRKVPSREDVSSSSVHLIQNTLSFLALKRAPSNSSRPIDSASISIRLPPILVRSRPDLALMVIGPQETRRIESGCCEA